MSTTIETSTVTDESGNTFSASTIVVRSKCHLHPEPWSPEEGSREWDRLHMQPIPPPTLRELVESMGADTPEFDLESFREAGFDGTQTLKHHWVSATICNQVANTTNRRALGWRLLEGPVFESMPRSQRCGTCDNEYHLC
jgi:hypothetical protein